MNLKLPQRTKKQCSVTENALFPIQSHCPNRMSASINKWAATWQNQQSECAPSEDSDQPGHPPSLIRAFAVRMKKLWVLSYPLSASEDSHQTGRMPRLIWVFAGRTLILWFCHVGAQIRNMTKINANSTTAKPFMRTWKRYWKVLS